MTHGPLPAALPCRRKIYAAHLFDADYFVINHLGTFLRRVLPLVIGPGATVADIGCGEQPLRSWAEDAGGVYTGIDVRQNAQGSVAVMAELPRIPLPDACFDVILCTEVLEHVSDTCAAIAELARLLRPDGRIVLTAPFAYPLHEEPFDFTRLTPHQVCACAHAAGLVVDTLETAGNELEVMATVWSNLWGRTGRHPTLVWLRRLRSAGFRLLYGAGNSLAVVGSAVLRPLLPRKSCLNVMAVLAKPGAPESRL